MILLTIVVVQAPAVLAGSLAGERERGVLQLLLTTAVSPREIVLGRLLGKLSQVGMILLAGLPLLALLAAWNGYGLFAPGDDLLAPGRGRPGRRRVGRRCVGRLAPGARRPAERLHPDADARLSPMLWRLGLPAEVADLLESFNPYLSMNRLVWSGEIAPALATSASGW